MTGFSEFQLTDQLEITVIIGQAGDVRLDLIR
jgi:hypothetical protein